jgi:hypothetical protein
MRKASFRSRELRARPSEQKRPYSRLLYLVLFDTSLEIECVTLFTILNKNKSHFWTDLLPWKKLNTK